MADNPRDVLSFEAVKVSMNQTKDGTKITLVIHPNEVQADMLTDPIGSRYRVAMVLLDDEDQPVVRHSPEREAVRAAGMLAKTGAFQEWCLLKGETLESSEEAAAAYIRRYCQIESRSQLGYDKLARQRFDQLRLTYSRSVST